MLGAEDVSFRFVELLCSRFPGTKWKEGAHGYYSQAILLVDPISEKEAGGDKQNLVSFIQRAPLNMAWSMRARCGGREGSGRSAIRTEREGRREDTGFISRTHLLLRLMLYLKIYHLDRTLGCTIHFW